MLWALFGLWLVFTLLDLTISGLAIRFGATEKGLLFLISNDWQLTCFIKGIASFLFGMVLVAYRQKGLLAISCALYLSLCVYNGWVLLRQAGAEG
ncbi:MAG: hypothetical protein Q8K68_10420 [Nitrospirota bacterium]|nr:hypothetical protein [Nitrospirota bacterium]